MSRAPQITMVALDGVSHSSAGAMLDCYAYMRGRVQQVLSQEAPVTVASGLSVLSLDGAPVAMNGGGSLPVDGAVGSGQSFNFIWLPAFRGLGYEQMQRRLAGLEPFLEWLRDQVRQGAVVGASGIAAVLPIAARLADDVAVPIAPALRPLARSMFPRAHIDESAPSLEAGQLLISSGLAHDYPLIIRGLERASAPTLGRWLRSVVGLPDDTQRQPVGDMLMHAASLWLDQRFATNLSIRELADEHSLSHSALSRRFRKAFGMSPKAYVQHMRIRAAQHQLEATDRSIDAIAAIVGFSDTRLFRSAFRKVSGMTASEWRRSHMSP